jgi:hypothetical protein
LRRSLRQVAAGRANQTLKFSDVKDILETDKLSQFEKNELAGALIQNAAEVNASVATRALIALYKLQTDEERAEGRSIHRNGQGFDREFSRIGSELAERAIGGARLSVRDIEKVLVILQRFRVQLVKYVDEDTLRWVLDEDDDETSGRDAPDKAPATGEDDEEDEDDEEYDDYGYEDDFVTSDDELSASSDEEDEKCEDAPDKSDEKKDHKSKPLKKRPYVIASSSEDDDDHDEKDAKQAKKSVTPKPSAPRATVSPKKTIQPPTRQAAHGDLVVTEYGVRGAMMFTGTTETLFQHALSSGARSADQIYTFMRGVPGLRVADVHVRLWQQQFVHAQAGPSSLKGSYVNIYLDGAFRYAQVVDEVYGMLRLNLVASKGEDYVWVQACGGSTLLYRDTVQDGAPGAPGA